MLKDEEVELMRLFALYAANVYEPVDDSGIADSLLAAKRFARLGREKLVTELRVQLNYLVKDGYLLRVKSGEYVVTYRGLKAISERKLGFTRDKHRLYLLKTILKRRG